MSEFDLSHRIFGQLPGDPMFMDPMFMDPMMHDPMFADPAGIMPAPAPETPAYSSPDPMDMGVPGMDPLMMEPGIDPMHMPSAPRQPTLLERRREWEGREIYKVIIEEIMMYRHGDLVNFPRHMEHYRTGWDALFTDLQNISRDPAMEVRRQKLQAAQKAIADFNLSLKPLQDEQKALLDARMPVTRRIRELREDIKSIKGFVANTREGRPVAAWLYQKFGDQANAVRLQSQYEAELDTLLPQLQAANDAVDAIGVKIGELSTAFYADNPSEQDIQTTFRDMVMEYTVLHPEMAIRRLEIEIRVEAEQKDAEIKAIVAQEKLDAVQEKEDFIRIFKQRSDEYVGKNDMMGSYIRAYYQVVWRTVWLQYGRKLILDQQEEYQKRAQAIENEGKALQNTSDWYKLTHAGEIEKIGLRLSTEGKKLETANEYLDKKTKLFQIKAQAIKDELSVAQAEFERIKKFYDERVAYVHSDEFTRKCLREWKEYKNFKDTHADIRRFFWQNYYERKNFQTYPMGISPEIPPMIDFMVTPPEFYAAGKSFPHSWPTRKDLFMMTGFEWVEQKYWQKYREAENEFKTRMKFDVPKTKHVLVESLLDLWLSPAEHRKFIEGEAKAFGWSPKEVKPVFRRIHDLNNVVEEMRDRFKLILNRLEEHFLQSVNMEVPDFSVLTPDQIVKLYDRGVKYLQTMTPKMPEIHGETKKIRDRVLAGTADRSETIAYMEALKIVRRYGYWTYVTRMLQHDAQNLKRGVSA